MENKKKYHGGLLAFFLLCCVFLFGNCINSYATNTLTPLSEFDSGDMYNVLDYFVNLIESDSYMNNKYSSMKTTLKNIKNNNSYLENTTNSFNTILLQKLGTTLYNSTYLENLFFCLTDTLKCGFSNNTIGNNYEHIKVEFQRLNGVPQYTTQYIDDNHSVINSYIFGMNLISSNAYWLFYNNASTFNDYFFSSYITKNVQNNVAHFPFLGFFGYRGSVYTKTDANSSFEWLLVDDSNIITNRHNIIPEPEEPSGDISGDNSGDTPVNPSGEGGGGGTIDYTNQLNNINAGIVNIQNQISGDSQKIIDNQNNNTQTIVNSISGETQKVIGTLTDNADISDTVVTSGDIKNSLGFEMATDPYANFWFEVINGLKTALLGSNRSISIDFMNNTYIINLDNFTLQMPSILKGFLTVVSSFLFVWLMIKWWKIIIDKLTSGGIDEVLAMNEEERYC